MRLGILSDTHDNLLAIGAALRLFHERGVHQLVHCGDVVSPGAAACFRSIPTHFVRGNCDDPLESLQPVIQSHGGILHGDVGFLEVAGRKLAWTHGHQWSRLLALEQSGEYDFVFFGHTHQAQHYKRQHTWVINPGALYRAHRYTCVILDAKSGEFEFVEVSKDGAATGKDMSLFMNR